ncbi:hypothetical protein [Paraburkholderia caribensis]|uniref:hypothetical protein n=1 Tax=Paraburkholderia caribensis TaxID=75105 RepID=UPI00078E6FD7|nr:hypothetical protein [Paraburkholderia caribensis]AMV42282.1 hypothetical protein ATN79_06265 [Paraburkholderia caribensis]
MKTIEKFLRLVVKELFGTIVFVLCLASIMVTALSVFASSAGLFLLSFVVFIVTAYTYAALYKVHSKPLSEIFHQVESL